MINFKSNSYMNTGELLSNKIDNYNFVWDNIADRILNLSRIQERNLPFLPKISIETAQDLLAMHGIEVRMPDLSIYLKDYILNKAWNNI